MVRPPSSLRTRRPQRGLIAAGAAVAAVRALLWILPYRSAAELMRRRARGAAGTEGAEVAERIARDVGRVARIVPRATCLVQALAAEWLCARAGIAAEVCFGVARGSRGVEAHAWLESGGRVVLGGEEAARFTPLRPT